MDTVELEALLRREQHFVVPSYSEVMLMQNTIANSNVRFFLNIKILRSFAPDKYLLIALIIL